MTYAKIIDGEVAAYPYTERDLRRDNPQTSFPRVIDMPSMDRFGVVEVQPNPAPVTTAGQIAEEVGPVLVEGQWEQGWRVRNKTGVELAEAKLAKWRIARRLRDQAIEAGVTVPGLGTFDSDDASRANINGAVTMALVAATLSQPFAIGWKLADNSVAQLDGQTMIGAGVAVGQHVAAAHAKAQALGLAIDAAGSFAELEAINIEEGWPG